MKLRGLLRRNVPENLLDDLEIDHWIDDGIYGRWHRFDKSIVLEIVDLKRRRRK